MAIIRASIANLARSTSLTQLHPAPYTTTSDTTTMGSGNIPLASIRKAAQLLRIHKAR